MTRPRGLIPDQEGDEVADGVTRFGDGHVNWYVVEENGALTIVDTGMPRHRQQLEGWLKRRDARPQDIEAVVLTHGHPDHLGVAEHLRRTVPTPVHVHERDRALAMGVGLRRPPKRIVRNLWRPHNLTVFLRWVRAGVLSVPPLQVANPYDSSDVIDVPGRFRIIHAPGHTAGSSMLVAEERGLIFSGDALCTLDPVTGRRGLGPLPRGLNDDDDQALASLRILLELGGGTFLPGHGDPWTGTGQTAYEHATAGGLDWG